MSQLYWQLFFSSQNINKHSHRICSLKNLAPNLYRIWMPLKWNQNIFDWKVPNTYIESSLGIPASKVLLNDNHIPINDFVSFCGSLIRSWCLQRVAQTRHKHTGLGHLCWHILASLELRVVRHYCLSVTAEFFNSILLLTHCSIRLGGRI